MKKLNFIVKQSERMNIFKSPSSVWNEFTGLSQQYKSVNLGQGFPDWAAQDFVKENMIKAVKENFNQYSKSQGHPPLTKKLAALYARLLGREICPEKNVVVGVGASEVLYSIFQSFISQADEVILISPAFDIYITQIEVAGGICVHVPLRLHNDQFHLDFDELKNKFSNKTKAIVINTPHNPTGKIFSLEELKKISEIVSEYPNVMVICDEVYEYMTYEKEFHRFAKLENMWERTLSVSSGGKTFSVTGWKTGWAVGPEHFIKIIATIQQSIQFCVPTPQQQALSLCFDDAEKEFKGHKNYYIWLQQDYLRKRDKLFQILQKSGLKPYMPEGSFFILADISNIQIPEKYLNENTIAKPKMTRDWAFCRFLTIEIGVTAIPTSCFYSEKDEKLAENLVRFAFCKEDEALLQAEQKLKNLSKYFIK